MLWQLRPHQGLTRHVCVLLPWDQCHLLQAALAGFLFQHGCKERAVSRHYLDGLFQRDPASTAGPISHH